jgi:hypothetical protein
MAVILVRTSPQVENCRLRIHTFALSAANDNKIAIAYIATSLDLVCRLLL